MSDSTPLPSYSSSDPTPPSGRSGAPVAVPTQVNTSYWLYIAAAIVSVIILLLSAFAVDATRKLIRQAAEKSGSHLTSTQLDAAATASIVFAVVLGLIFAALFVLFAVFMRRGANWARIVLLIITVLSLTGAAGSYGLGILRLILGVVATVLIFMRPANEYFRAVKASRTPMA
jgi:hypothetical protein